MFTFPRAKVVMTAPMNLPLHGKVRLFDTSKDELLALWHQVIGEHQLDIRENTRVDKIVPQSDDSFKILTNTGDELICNHVLLALGRRGTPRKLGIPGEESQKVAYRLLEPERISGKKIIVVGGGDSAIESALLCSCNNYDNGCVKNQQSPFFLRNHPIFKNICNHTTTKQQQQEFKPTDFVYEFLSRTGSKIILDEGATPITMANSKRYIPEARTENSTSPIFFRRVINLFFTRLF